MANSDLYYDNIDTAAVDSDESESENRYNIKSQTTAKPQDKFNNKNRPTTYSSKSVEEENFAYVLSCEKNEKIIEEIIKEINIEEKLPFGVITEGMLVSSNNRKESIKQMTAVLYKVITKIWKQSGNQVE
ncbi:17790_t:CDS:2 [Gigaspora margarita]|uniref:17790_t:CDS:1 n=1 Tax=Gigaspora margarita TaxID=4874 RepID=A0ABN7UP25_GIGMA|nr:17790_t:CDS:2 [Gigaspora margarita]